MAEEQGGDSSLPIEEIGIDLVVNQDENFVSAMSQAGRQFTTFSRQSDHLAESLPVLNKALDGISAALFTVNNRSGSTAKIAEALRNLSKIPTDMTKIEGKAQGAAVAVDSLLTKLVALNENYQKALRAKRDLGGAEGARAEKKRLNAAEGVSQKDVPTKQGARATQVVKYKVDPGTLKPIGEILKPYLSQELVANLQLDIDQGKIQRSTSKSILAALKQAADDPSVGNEMSKALNEIGSFLPPSLSAGILGNKDDAVAAATNLGRSVIEAIRDATGVHSYSDEGISIGEWLGKSHGVGLLRSVPYVEAAGRAVGEAAMRGLGMAGRGPIARGGGSSSAVRAAAAAGEDTAQAAIDEAVEAIRRDREALNQRIAGARAEISARPVASTQAGETSPAVADTNLRSSDRDAWSRMFLAGLKPEQREALERMRATEAAGEGLVFDFRTDLIRGAGWSQLDMIMKMAGVSGYVPGTYRAGNDRNSRSLVGSQGPLGANRVVQSKGHRGGGATPGTGLAWQDFNSPIYQQRMREFKGPGDFGQAEKGSNEWDAIVADYSPLTRRLPWQGREVKVPKQYKDQQAEFLQGVKIAIQKVLVKKLKHFRDDLPAMGRRLRDPQKLAEFTKMFDEEPELAAYRKFGPEEIAKYIKRLGSSRKKEEDFAEKHGDPQIKAVTSKLYDEARKAIMKYDTIDEIVEALENLDTEIRAMFRDKFKAGQGEIWGALAERPDPVIKQQIAELKSMASRASSVHPGRTIGEEFEEYRAAQRILEESVGGSFRQARRLYADFSDAKAGLGRPRISRQQLAEKHYRDYMAGLPDLPAVNQDDRDAFGAWVQKEQAAAEKKGQTVDKKRLKEMARAFVNVRRIKARPHVDTTARGEVDRRQLFGSLEMVTPQELARMEAQVPVMNQQEDARKEIGKLAAQESELKQKLSEMDKRFIALILAYSKKNGKTIAEVSAIVANYSKMVSDPKTAPAAAKKYGAQVKEMSALKRERDGVEAAISAATEARISTESALARRVGDSRRTRGFNASVVTENKSGKRIYIDAARLKYRGYLQDYIIGSTATAARGASTAFPIQEYDHAGRGLYSPGVSPEYRQRQATLRQRRAAAAARERLMGAEATFSGNPAKEREDFKRTSALRAGDLSGQLKNLTADYGTVIDSAAGLFNRGWKEAWDSIEEPSRVFFSRAAANVKALVRKGALTADAGQEFEAEIDKADATLSNLGGRIGKGKGGELSKAELVAPFQDLAERIKALANLAVSVERTEKVAAEMMAAMAADEKRQRETAFAAGRGAANRRLAEINSPQARAWRTYNSGQTQTMSQAGVPSSPSIPAAPAFSFPDDWVIRIINAIHAAADKVVAAVAAIKAIAAPAGAAAPAKAASTGRSQVERDADTAFVQADLMRTSEVDAYRAAHTAMRQVRMANELDPTDVARLQDAIDEWRRGAIRAAVESIKQQATRGDAVDAFRASRSQADLDLQRIIGPEIRKTITNQELAVNERTMRTLTTAFDDISRAERAATTALQKSNAPAAQVGQSLREVAEQAEAARYALIEISQKAGSFQILDAQIDQVVGSFREMGEQAKFAARQADRTPLMQRQLAVQTRGDSITRDAERLKSTATRQLGGKLPQAQLDVLLRNIDQAAADARGELAVLLNTARQGGAGAESSMVAFNLELQKIRANASLNTDALREQIAVARQAVARQAASSPAASAKAPAGPGNLGSDTRRAVGAVNRKFLGAFRQAGALRANDFVDQNELTKVYDRIVALRTKISDGIRQAIRDTQGQTVTEQASAVRLAVEQYRDELTRATGEMSRMEKVAGGVLARLQKIDDTARSAAMKLADLRRVGAERIVAGMPSSLPVNMTRTQDKALEKFRFVVPTIEGQLADMYERARRAAVAGDLAAVAQLTRQIKNLTDRAEDVVDESVRRILARSSMVDRQLKSIEMAQKYAKDPQSYLQDRTIGRAKMGGISGWVNRAKLNLQETTALSEMRLAVAKEREQFDALSAVTAPLTNNLKALASGFALVYKVLATPITLPIAAFKGAALAVKTIRERLRLGGVRKDYKAGLNEDDRGQRYADMRTQYAALYEKMNGKAYSRDAVGWKNKFFAAPSFDDKSIKRQAQDFGKLQGAYEKLQKAAAKQGIIDAPVSAIARAARAALAPVNILINVMTFGMAHAGDETRKAAKAVDNLGNEIGQASKQKGIKKIFADMGTGVGLGFGMSFSMGIINSIQSIGWRIQSTISGIISGGFAAVIETEMRKMTIRSFVAQGMVEEAKGQADFGAIWTAAGKEADTYYKKITDMAKLSSFSRAPLLDLFGNMQVGGLTPENAEAVTSAVTMFGDAFMPGNKQMLDTFGQQMMQMLSQGVAQQVDLKLLAQQGIPVYKFLAENMASYAGKSIEEAQGQIFEDLAKGQIGATEALEAIITGMVKSAENFKGKAATTFNGMISTFKDLMLETSERIMQPVADNLFKPIIQFGNDLLQSNFITSALDDFGKRILEVSKIVEASAANALGVFLGLWSSLPGPVQEAIKGLALATTVIAALTGALAAAAAISALLAPILSIVSGGMIAASVALGSAITVYTTNLLGFRDWLNAFAAQVAGIVVGIGQTIAWGLLEAVGTISEMGAGVINGFLDNFTGNMERIYAAVYGWWGQIVASFSLGVATVEGWIAQAINSLWTLPQNMDDILGAVGQWFNDLGANFGAVFSWMGEWVGGVVETMWAIPENMGDIVGQMFDYGAQIVEVFADGMQSAINVVFDALSAIGAMFGEWLEPHSPPKLLPNLDKWGTAAADEYLKGWTQADFGILNDLSSKLEGALATDEGALEEGEVGRIRAAIAQMVGNAVDFGKADISPIMAAMPGWGGRAEQVARLAQAYANLTVTQHALTVQQESLDKITAQYDARLTPLQNKLKSLQNKQEDMDLSSQIKEWSRVLDNIYATDEQKKAARLKLDELKLTKQINDVEMERDSLTDPINDRIAAMTVENQEAQKALDLANERWAIEMGMLDAGKGKGEGGAEDAADKAKEEKAGTEKDRQFTQPKLNVPAFSGIKGLGSIAEKMKGVSEKIQGYFTEMAKKTEPLQDAIGGIGGAIDTMAGSIQAGMDSGMFTTEGGFVGFLNNIGVFAGTALGAVNLVIQRVNALATLWNNPLGVVPGYGEKGGPIGPKPDGGFGSFNDVQVVNTEMRLRAVVDDLKFSLDDAKLQVETFAAGVKKSFDEVGWEQIQLDMTTNMTKATATIRDWVAGVPGVIAAALGMDIDNLVSADPLTQIGEIDKGTDKINAFSAKIGDATGRLLGRVVDTIAVEIGKYVLTTEQVSAIGAASIIIVAEVIKNLYIGMQNFLDSAEASKAAEEAGKQVGRILVGLVMATVYAGVFAAFDADEVSLAQEGAESAVRDMIGQFITGLIGAMVDEVGQRMGLPPGAVSGAIDQVQGAYDAVAENPSVKAVADTLGGMTSPFGAPGAVVNGLRQVGEDWTQTPQGQAFGSWVIGGNAAAQASWDTRQLFPSPEAIDRAATPGTIRRGVLAGNLAPGPQEAQSRMSLESVPSYVLPTQQYTATDVSAYMPTLAEQQKIGQGVATGIGTSVVDQMALEIPKIVDTMLDGFFTALGIQSPSTVMQDKVGMPIGQGIVAGIRLAFGGAAEGEGPGGIVGQLYHGILQATTLFGINLNVAWFNLKTRITGTLGILKEEWLGVFGEVFEEANQKLDDFSVLWIEEKVPAFRDAIIELAVQAKDGVLQAMQDAVDGLNEKLSQMLAALQSDDIKAQFYGAGYELGGSLVDGIAEALTGDDAHGKFSDMADSVIAEITRLLKEASGVNSPSKVMRDEVGVPLSEGIAKGMMMPAAKTFMSDAASRTIDYIVHSFGGQTPAMQTAYHYLGGQNETVTTRGGGSRTYIMNLSVTPQQAANVEYNYRIAEILS